MASKATKKTNKGFWIITVIVIIIIFLVFIIIKKQSTNVYNQTYENQSIISALSPSIIPTGSFNIYNSKIFQVTIKAPQEYKISEGSTAITLQKNNSEKEIKLFRIGTNNDSLDGYLYDITESNHYTLTNKSSLLINNLPTIKVDIDGRRHYLFYKDNMVFSLDTLFPELYSDLDQIARSFRYEP